MAADIRASVYSQLLALFGPSMPLYPDAIPEKAPFPAILYRLENINNTYTLDGICVFTKGSVVFHSFAYDKDVCVQNAQTISGIFTGLRGALGSCYIGWSFKLIDETDAECAAPDGSQKILYEDRLTFTAGWNSLSGSPPPPTTYQLFAGTSADVVLSANQVTALPDYSGFKSTYAGIYSFGTGDYKYFSFPDVLGSPTSWIDPSSGFPIALAMDENYPLVDTSGNNYYTVTIGTLTYRVYRTLYPLAGALTITVA